MILVVSRIFERKGVQYILKAFQGLNHDYTLNIVGDGPYLNTLKTLSYDLKLKVNFLGFLDNQSDKLKNLYEESEIFIFTSESENFPVVLLEAMVAGMAIITTTDTGCAEVVGDSAILINSKDSNAIMETLNRLINNSEQIKNLQLAARKRVEELFGWENIAQKYLELYFRIISPSSLLSEVYKNKN
ncbi:MAG: glycosyltransferase family 4 protein [Ignavibacteriaceae bacterium]|jgi:glycosyltransferase involved in cell wall biosynthesis